MVYLVVTTNGTIMKFFIVLTHEYSKTHNAYFLVHPKHSTQGTIVQTFKFDNRYDINEIATTLKLKPSDLHIIRYDAWVATACFMKHDYCKEGAGKVVNRLNARHIFDPAYKEYRCWNPQFIFMYGHDHSIWKSPNCKFADVAKRIYEKSKDNTFDMHVYVNINIAGVTTPFVLIKYETFVSDLYECTLSNLIKTYTNECNASRTKVLKEKVLQNG